MKYLMLIIILNFSSAIFSLSKHEQNKLAKELLIRAKLGDFSSFEDHAKQGANLNYQDSDGKNILMYAIKFNRDDIVNMLQKYNIDPNVLDENNLSALMQAVLNDDNHNNKLNIVSDLLKFKNLNLNRQGRYGGTALDAAYSQGKKFYAEQIEFLEKLQKSKKEKKPIIELLKSHGAKTANDL